MDYRYPISAFQAFAICLSSFDTKIACEWGKVIISLLSLLSHFSYSLAIGIDSEPWQNQ
jgi:hypothetical protein